MKWIMLCLPLFGCASICTEQGGKVVQDGETYIWQWIDIKKGIGYMQPYPNFVCVKEDQ